MSVFDVLKSTGLDVRDYRVPGYRGHGIKPVGALIHHTASPAGSGDLPSLGICLNGRTGLPGPLCQVLIGRAGTVAVVTDGLANHAGVGKWPGITSGNKQLVGVEIENNGVGEPYSQGVYDTTVIVAAALVNAYGSTLIGHKEWAPGRKIDPSFPMDDFRAAVQAHSAPRPVPPTVDYGRFDMADAQTKLVPCGPLDQSGCGWTPINFDTPVTRVVGLGLNGPFPPVDGYWSLPDAAAQVRDGVVYLSVTRGQPGTTPHVWVTAA